MVCLQCGHTNPLESTFCETCGTQLATRCPRCDQTNPPGSRFCNACGRSLAPPPTPTDPRDTTPRFYTPLHLVDKMLGSRASLEGEHKEVTVLFCNVVNSTTLAERLGPEVLHQLLRRFFDLALMDIHRHEGTVNQFFGDGFLALFGAPVVYEDHARRAVLAALGIHEMVQRRRALDLAPGLELSVCMGLNTGLVAVWRIGEDLRMHYTSVGDTINVGARLEQMAEPNAILISEATACLVHGYVDVETLGPLAVKGKAEPVTAYKVVGLGPRYYQEYGVGGVIGGEPPTS